MESFRRLLLSTSYLDGSNEGNLQLLGYSLLDSSAEPLVLNSQELSEDSDQSLFNFPVYLLTANENAAYWYDAESSQLFCYEYQTKETTSYEGFPTIYGARIQNGEILYQEAGVGIWKEQLDHSEKELILAEENWQNANITWSDYGFSVNESWATENGRGARVRLYSEAGELLAESTEIPNDFGVIIAISPDYVILNDGMELYYSPYDSTHDSNHTELEFTPVVLTQ